MVNTLKRKSESDQDGDTNRRLSDPPVPSEVADSTNAEDGAASVTQSSMQTDRNARFAALKARNTDSRKANLKATTTEKQRQSVNSNDLTLINKKRDIATHRILQADTEDAGEDFERKRAWDWTIEESEKWDDHIEKKQRQQDDVGFQDYASEARKIYQRHIKHMQPNREAYEREKAALLEKATATGGLEIVETEDGEMMAIDRDGKFYSTADNTDFVNNKPTKAAIDRLVGEIQKQEDLRNKKRRNKGEGDGDITYINEKNKQFNEKLNRFYNKYTADIRESFERGTAL